MEWSYDEFGNRLTQAGTGDPAPPPMTLAYDEATNRITTAGYSYDLNGNLEHIPQSQSMPEISNITWDAFDRMTAATANGTTTQYKYDAFGRRVARVTPSATDTFFYDAVRGATVRERFPGALPSRLTRPGEALPDGRASEGPLLTSYSWATYQPDRAVTGAQNGDLSSERSCWRPSLRSPSAQCLFS